MRTRLIATATLLPVLLGLPAAARAQNNTDRQLMADMRMLHEELQQARLLMNTLTEQIKATNARIDAVEKAVVSGFANQKLDLDEMTATAARVSDKVSENTVRVGQFASELSALREGIGQSNTMLSQILALLAPAPVPGLAGVDPAAGGGAPLPPLTTPPTGAPAQVPPGQIAPGAMPQSPAAAYGQANNLYFQGQYELAIERFGMFVKDFPADVRAPDGYMTMGLSQYQLGRYRDALDSFNQLIQKYPAWDRVPEAYLQLGVCHEQLKDLPNARRAFQEAIRRTPDDSAVHLQATQRLQKIGGFD